MIGSSYWGLGFFSFLWHFLTRISALLLGRVPFSSLEVDEVQIFVLICLGVSCAILGSFLVLRKMTMLANSISHTILLGIVIAYLFVGLYSNGVMVGVSSADFPTLLIASMITSLLTAVFTDLLHRVFRLQKDVSIGLVFTFLFALGVVLVTLFTRNSHIGTEVITGNIDLLGKEDLASLFYLALGNILLLLLFYKEYVTTAFDPLFARMSRISNFVFTYLLLFQTSATIIGGMRAVGIILVLALLVVPILTARMMTRSLLSMIGVAALLSSGVAIISVAFSRHLLTVYGLPLSTAGLVVVFQTILWKIVVLTRKRQIFSQKKSL